MLQLLTEVGVKMSLDFSHIQLVLKLAKELSKNNNVDYNIKRAVVHATVELTVLLRSKQARENISLHSPLYLLNNEDVLTDCSKLVVFDISSVHRPVLPSEFTYLNSLQNISAATYWNPKELLELLPKDLGLKSLKSILQYTMTADATLVQTAHSHVTTIEQILRSSGIPQITSFISMVLNCGSVFKITDIIRGSLPGVDNIEQDMVDSEPILGEVIPECWHHRLDQNIFNYFTPQELVGYEKESDVIVYAHVLYCNNAEAYDNEEDMKQIFELKYTITLGSDTELEATVLQLYKFVSAVEEPVPQDSSSGELELHETGDSESTKQARQTRLAGDKQTIRAAVKAAWNLPEEQK